MLLARVGPIETDDTDRWRAFTEALRRQYRRLGAARISHPGPDPTIHLLVAETSPGRPVAGIRIHANTPTTTTPLQRALDDPGVQRWVAEKKTKRSAELSGFWVDYRPAGSGLGSTVFQAAVAYARYLGYDELFAFHHVAMHRLARSVGLTRVPRFRPFAYPTPQYSSSVWHLDFSATSQRGAMQERLAAMQAQFDAQSCIYWLSEAHNDAVAFAGRTGPPVPVLASRRFEDIGNHHNLHVEKTSYPRLAAGGEVGSVTRDRQAE